MHVFLIILLFLAGLIVLFLVLALFTKKDYNVVREINIRQPKSKVFDYIRHLKNQDEYSLWTMRDPNMQKNYTGNDGTVGFIYAWDSLDKSAGKGEQEIKKIAPNERLDIEIRFIKPFAAVGQIFMSTDAVSENDTKVKWGLKSAMNYPMNVLMLFMKMDKILGKDLETSLHNLKNNLEK